MLTALPFLIRRCFFKQIGLAILTGQGANFTKCVIARETCTLGGNRYSKAHIVFPEEY